MRDLQPKISSIENQDNKSWLGGWIDTDYGHNINDVELLNIVSTN